MKSVTIMTPPDELLQELNISISKGHCRSMQSNVRAVPDEKASKTTLHAASETEKVSANSSLISR